ncbi:MAG: hypothetical protein LBP87_15490 [Planctomycetaceae bacterium]|nr:hypothetical protein [Planctomycetaceae bacterium]
MITNSKGSQCFAGNIGRRTRRQGTCFRTEIKFTATVATMGKNPSAQRL